MYISLETQWLDEFLKRVWYLTVKKTLDKSIKKSILLTERVWKQNTPVDTWLLRNSYETQFSSLEWRLRNFREYAPYVEGRVGFLKETVWDVENRVQRIFENDIQDMINDLVE